MDAETAYHLCRVYKEKANAIVKDISYWGSYLPPSHIQRLEIMLSTFETMYHETKRLLANATPRYEGDAEQIAHYLKVLDAGI